MQLETIGCRTQGCSSAVIVRAELQAPDCESIPTNIVEGCGRVSQKEFANYPQTSFSSSNELEYHLRVSHDYGLLKERLWQSLTNDTVEVRMMLAGLIKKVRGTAKG